VKADPVQPVINELSRRGIVLRASQGWLMYSPIEAVDEPLKRRMQRVYGELVSYAEMQERRVCELLHRYELGQFLPHVRTRLAEVFKDDPPDAWERLIAACDYLGITGEYLEEVAEQATERRVLN
jgi:hypothetical protein